MPYEHVYHRQLVKKLGSCSSQVDAHVDSRCQLSRFGILLEKVLLHLSSVSEVVALIYHLEDVAWISDNMARASAEFVHK